MYFSNRLIPILIGTTAAILMPYAARAIALPQIEQIARGITVLIDGLNPGSGVIVAREGNRYVVLTAKHVVATEDEYTLVAPDGQRYPLDYRRVRPLPGVDLALLEFESDRNYTVAALANSPYNAQFRHVFVAGWVSSDRRLAPGLLLSQNFALTHAQEPINNGYELFYTSITELGMSGGPVLDTDGRVIGLHGRVEGEEIYDNASGQVFRVKLGFSSGIPVPAFLHALAQAGISLSLRADNSTPTPLSPQESAAIAAAFPISPVTGNMTALSWANRGNELYRAEQFDEALEAFDRAIALQGNFYQAWYGRAQVLYVLGKYRDALAAYDRVLQFQPSLALVWRNKGVVLALARQPEEALNAFDRALQLQPDDYVTWYLRGNLFRNNLRSPQAALDSYNRALQYQPNFADAWTGKGRSLYELGNARAALSALDNATQLNPNLGDSWHWRGLALLDLGNFAEALDSFDKAIPLTPENAQLWLSRGIALAHLGRYADAAAAAEKALDIQPYDPDPEIIEFLNSLEPYLP
jgi:tetratricopeptide (TPR) repeat protein